ncbi:MAG TPA: universal stress protein [Desulfobacterales bacterium]|nr:universal stress protein [Desulfobacterales bacterium]
MKIMVCYNGSKAAQAALKLAHTHAKVWNSTLAVIKAISRELPLKHSYVREAEQNLDDETKDLLDGDDASYETLLLISSPTPGEQLVQFAEKRRFDQIFIGIERKSKVGKLLFGSTAQYVILKAPCSVVTVQEKDAE